MTPVLPHSSPPPSTWHSLGLRMVAEGVENRVAYAELKRLGCDQAQGYLISRPMPAAELDLWLADQRIVDQPHELPAAAPFRGPRQPAIGRKDPGL